MMFIPSWKKLPKCHPYQLSLGQSITIMMMLMVIIITIIIIIIIIIAEVT